MEDTRGEVWLIGAGPGDEGLMTVKGLAKLAQADAVVYDRLANPALLAKVRTDAQQVDVGKLPGRHAVPQEEINRLLIRLAKQGKKVARLKGGDPFVFGRGGEEALALRREGIPFQVIPGVTSACAAPAYAGIPVTHRGLASSFHVITGHNGEDIADHGPDYALLAKLEGTLVFLMGVSRLREITQALLAHGMAPDTPAAVISRGTTVAQVKVVATVSAVAHEAEARRIAAPAVIVIGKTVKLEEELGWFMPGGALQGKSVVITRRAEQIAELAAPLGEMGGNILPFPCISLKEYEDDPFARFLRRQPEEGDWLVFTSPNGAAFFFRKLARLHVDIRRFCGYRIAAIGSTTANCLQERGIYPDLIPEEYTSDALANALAGMAQGTVVLLRAKRGAQALPERLRASGAMVLEVPLYETLPASQPCPEQEEALLNADYLTFLSASAVQGFLAKTRGMAVNKLFCKPAFAIGRCTCRALKDSGFQNVIMAEQATMASLLEKIREWSENNGV